MRGEAGKFIVYARTYALTHTQNKMALRRKLYLQAEDLKLVMGKLEHWAHRLFPKLTFDDFSARLEKLGHTKSVQVIHWYLCYYYVIASVIINNFHGSFLCYPNQNPFLVYP